MLTQQKEGRISAADLLRSITDRPLSWEEFWATQETITTQYLAEITDTFQRFRDERNEIESRLQAGPPCHAETRSLYEETWDQHQQGMEPLNAEFQADLDSGEEDGEDQGYE
ncbi:hypothetical protein LQW54_000937 [Pestalotiopsis sp. IQ-011]